MSQGDQQKLSRLAASRTFQFPPFARPEGLPRTIGRVEVFKRIGTATMPLDRSKTCYSLDKKKAPRVKARLLVGQFDKLLFAGYWILVMSYWLWAIGYGLLVIGIGYLLWIIVYWSWIIGYWLFDMGCNEQIKKQKQTHQKIVSNSLTNANKNITSIYKKNPSYKQTKAIQKQSSFLFYKFLGGEIN